MKFKSVEAELEATYKKAWADRDKIAELEDKITELEKELVDAYKILDKHLPVGYDDLFPEDEE